MASNMASNVWKKVLSIVRLIFPSNVNAKKLNSTPGIDGTFILTFDTQIIIMLLSKLGGLILISMSILYVGMNKKRPPRGPSDDPGYAAPRNGNY